MDWAETNKPVAEVLRELGQVFALFDSQTQDSGHISYGVADAQHRRWFVKTSGSAEDGPGGGTNQERRDSLRKSATIANALAHAALIPTDRVIDAADGVLTVSRWFDGEVLHSPSSVRADPTQPFGRFQRLPVDEIMAALDVVIDLHVRLELAGWMSGDLYDGSLMYDFDNKQIKVIDFEFYHRGIYTNDVGRLPGSTRFMAPEEFVKGATIDARTTAFNLGRMIEVFLLTHHPDCLAIRAVATHATQVDPLLRPQTLSDFQAEWSAAASSE